MSEPNRHTESLFSAALAIESPKERAKFLDQACGADQQLRQQVEELLAAYPKVERFMEAPAAKPGITLDQAPLTESPGTVIGPYKLLEQIGEGGFGIVFMAEQQEPIRRKVALKILKPGMDTRQVIARFEAERQALALMDHPNIAHVFAGDETATGRPYFVMELVRGIPITDFCDQNQLPIRQRAHDPAVLFDESRDLGLHSQVEGGVAAALLGQEVEEIPLWHERHEAALRSQIRHVTQHNMVAADTSADLSDLLVRPFQKFFEQTEFVHDLKCRGMNSIAPEVAQEIGMLLQNQDLDPGPRQQIGQHYPGGTAAGHTTAGLQFLW